MGRPPIGKQAMSGAERQRRYLDRLLAGKSSVTKPKGPDGRDREIATLKARIAELQAAKSSVTSPLTRSYRREAGEPDFGEAGKLRAENVKLKSDKAKLNAMLQLDPDAAKLRKTVVDQRVEMASMRRAMEGIAKERDRHKRRAEPEYREAGKLLTGPNYRVIIKALHSDRMKQCTAAELATAERVVTALRPLFNE
jgi:hypothetical protein